MYFGESRTAIFEFFFFAGSGERIHLPTSYILIIPFLQAFVNTPMAIFFTMLYSLSNDLISGTPQSI